MIHVQFITDLNGDKFNELIAEVPQKGDTVLLGGKLREVKHRRWVRSELSFVLSPEVVVSS